MPRPNGEVRSFFGEGRRHDPDMEHLSSIFEILNERFGTDLTDADKLLLAFDKKFLQTIVICVDANEDFRATLGKFTCGRSTNGCRPCDPPLAVRASVAVRL